MGRASRGSKQRQGAGSKKISASRKLDRLLKQDVDTNSVQKIHKVSKLEKRKFKKALLVEKELSMKKEMKRSQNTLRDVSELLSSLEQASDHNTDEAATHRQILRKVNFPVRIGKSGVTFKTKNAVESSDMAKFQSTLAHPAFQQNPFSVLRQHLSNIAAIEQELK